MVGSPSHQWKDGILAERAIASDVAGKPDEVEAVTGRPPDTPERNSSFGSRAKARTGGAKAVEPDDAENKAVKTARKK